MSRRRKTPAQIKSDLDRAAEQRSRERLARLNPDEWGVDGEAMGLEANADVAMRAELDLKNRRRVYAHRVPWMDRVLDKGSPSWVAVNRLAEMMAVRMGTDGKPERVGAASGDEFALVRRRVTAGRIVDWVLGQVGAVDRMLLRELIEPPFQVVVRSAADDTGSVWQGWRATVVRITSEYDDRAQGARIRASADNLAQAWSLFDQLPRASKEAQGLVFLRDRPA